MASFHLTIARVHENLFEGKVSLATFPGSEGIFTVLANHEPTIAQLVSGTIAVRKEEGDELLSFPLQSGIIEISSNRAIVLL